MLGGALAVALGLEPLRALPSVEPATSALLLLPAGMSIALGLAAMATGVSGSQWSRWIILGTFAFVVNGVGTALELSGFSNLGGERFSVLANLPAGLTSKRTNALLIAGLLLCVIAVSLQTRRASAGHCPPRR